MPIPSNSRELNMADSPQLNRTMAGFMAQAANWFKET